MNENRDGRQPTGLPTQPRFHDPDIFFQRLAQFGKHSGVQAGGRLRRRGRRQGFLQHVAFQPNGRFGGVDAGAVERGLRPNGGLGPQSQQPRAAAPNRHRRPDQERPGFDAHAAKPRRTNGIRPATFGHRESFSLGLPPATAHANAFGKEFVSP